MYANITKDPTVEKKDNDMETIRQNNNGNNQGDYVGILTATQNKKML